MYGDELDYSQDVLTLKCPDCLVIGSIRQILHKEWDGSDDPDRVICDGPEIFDEYPIDYACTNCNWVD